MGRRRRRSAALSPAPEERLDETLARVAEVMLAARDDWWIIGSAAVALHAAAAPSVGDVDLLCSRDDLARLAVLLGLSVAPGDPDPLFRSAGFARWHSPPLVVELMAGFEVKVRERWRRVLPSSREIRPVPGGVVAVPGRAELRAMLTHFGRPKDLIRADLLA